jgi:hypothetical protein
MSADYRLPNSGVVRAPTGVSDFAVKMRDFDYFVKRLAKGSACGGPMGLKHYDALYRVICLGEPADIIDVGPGPCYPFVLIAHYFWRRGDVCRACALLEKARGGHCEKDEETAAELLMTAIREGAEGVRRIKTEDSLWSWASAFKTLLIAELDPRGRPAALRQVKKALEEFFDHAAERAPGDVAEAYNIFEPYTSDAPYVYIYYAALELDNKRGGGIRDALRRIACRMLKCARNASI